MFLLNWLKQYKQIRQEFSESTHCESCETLRLALSLANEEKTRLLDRLLEKPAVEERVDTSNLQPIRTSQVPWNVRRQMIEAADRQKAKDIQMKDRETAEAVKSNGVNKEIDELEKEIGILRDEGDKEIAHG